MGLVTAVVTETSNVEEKLEIPFLKPKKNIYWCPSCKHEEPVEHTPVLNPKSCPVCKSITMKHLQIREGRYAYRNNPDTHFGFIDPEGKVVEPKALEYEHHDISRRLGHSTEQETMQRGYTRFLHVPGHELGLTVPDTDKAKEHALNFLRKNHVGENVFISRVFWKAGKRGLEQQEKATYHWNPETSQHDPVPEVARWMKESYIDTMITRIVESSEIDINDPDASQTLSGKPTRFLTDTSGMGPFSRAKFGWYTHEGQNISSEEHKGAGVHGNLAQIANKESKLPRSHKAQEDDMFGRAHDAGWVRWIEEPTRLYAHVAGHQEGLDTAHKFLSSQPHNKATLVDIEHHVSGSGWGRKNKYESHEFRNPREAADFIMHRSLGREMHQSATAQYREDIEALIDQMLETGEYNIFEQAPDFHRNYTGKDLEALKNKEGRYPRKDSNGHSLIYYTGWSHLCPDCAYGREQVDEKPTTIRGAYSLKSGSMACKDCSKSIHVIAREPQAHEYNKWLKPLPGKPKPVANK